MKQIADFFERALCGTLSRLAVTAMVIVAIAVAVVFSRAARADTKIELGTGLTLYGHHGDGYGLYASVLPEWHIGRGWFLQSEIGIGYYGVSNEVRVTAWRPAPGDRRHLPAVG